MQRFTPLLADAARFTRHSPGDRWFVDETYMKVTGSWRYVYRAIDQPWMPRRADAVRTGERQHWVAIAFGPATDRRFR